jgi:hypothetical protein
MVSTVGNVSTMLNHFITETSLQKGQDILFTLVVVYDLTEDGRLMKILLILRYTKYLISKLLLGS